MVRNTFRSPLLAASTLLLCGVGCHSAMVDATVQNHSGTALSLLEVDYPSASFGTQNLADGADFHYRFKILGSGPLKITYTDSTRHDHAAIGPTLEEGSEGLVNITVEPSGVRWQTTFRQKR